MESIIKMNNKPTPEQIKKATDDYNRCISLGYEVKPETIRILAEERMAIIEAMRKGDHHDRS